MLIGTYRPLEVILGDRPLKRTKRELQAQGLCKGIPLEYLDEEAIADYLCVRWRNRAGSAQASSILLQSALRYDLRSARRNLSLSLTVEVMREGKLTWSEHRLGDCRTGLDISETFVKIAPGTHLIFLWCSPLNEMTILDRVMQKLHEETAQQPTQERKQRRSRVTG